MNAHIKKLVEVLNTELDLLSPEQVGGVMKAYLPAILSDESLLTAEQKQFDPELDYTKHLIYSCDAWSLQALIWRPDSKTPIHNHNCWCTVGVYDCSIIEERFENVNGKVKCIESVLHPKGVFVSLAPTGDDIHRILNPNTDCAITLHFYGINAFETPSSILETFSQMS